MTYLWMLKYIIPFVIGMALSVWLTSSYYKPIVESYKNENTKLTEANTKMEKTISRLEDDIQHNKKLCSQTIERYSKLIKDLQTVENLKPGNIGDTNEGEKVDSNNSIIGNLNIMWKNN